MRLNTLLMATVAGALLMQAPAALAQAQGSYIGLSGGFNFSDDSDIGGATIPSSSVETDTGWLALGSAGYRFGNGLRGELEVGYRDNDVDSVFGATSGVGNVTAKTMMGNLLFDLNSGGSLRPYIGGGLGMAQIDYDGVGPVNVALATIDDVDNVFAYQGIAGVSFGVSDAVELTTEYRYLATEDPGFNTPAGSVDGEYQSHALLVGLRWNFGTPKPAAQPMQAAAVQEPAAPVAESEPAALPRNFLVFFDWDKSDITAEAAVILKDAADYAKANGATRITATGHADRSGTDEYNMALSMRRAEAIKRQLIANGLGESDIGLDAKGESDPLVATEDGVREPQNRRVEIVLN